MTSYHLASKIAISSNRVCKPTKDITMKNHSDQSNTTITQLNDACRKRLRTLRENMGLSRPKFANLLGIPPTTLKNYELNYREIGGGALLLIAQHPQLSVHFHWLTTGKGEGPVKLEVSA